MQTRGKLIAPALLRRRQARAGHGETVHQPAVATIVVGLLNSQPQALMSKRLVRKMALIALIGLTCGSAMALSPNRFYSGVKSFSVRCSVKVERWDNVAAERLCELAQKATTEMIKDTDWEGTLRIEGKTLRDDQLPCLQIRITASLRPELDRTLIKGHLVQVQISVRKNGNDDLLPPPLSDWAPDDFVWLEPVDDWSATAKSADFYKKLYDALAMQAVYGVLAFGTPHTK